MVDERVDAVISSTDAVETAAKRMRDEGGEISLPPALGLSGPSDITAPVGSSIEATYTLTNVGVSPVTDVEVTLEGYDLSISPSSVDSLSPGESATLTVSGTVSDVTESPLVVSAGAASSRTGLNVVDAGGHLDRALAVIDDIETHLESLSTAGNGSNGKGNGNGKKNGKGRQQREPHPQRPREQTRDGSRSNRNGSGPTRVRCRRIGY